MNTCAIALVALLAALALPLGARAKDASAPKEVKQSAASAAPATPASTASPAAAHSVSLRITEAGSKRPIAKAKVDVFDAKNQWLSPQRQANSEGRLVIEKLPAAKYRLQISAPSPWQASNLPLDLTVPKPALEYAVELSKAAPAKPAP